MKNILTLGLILFVSINSFGQLLSLTDLQNVSNKTNWEYVNQYLMNKGWEYYDSEKGSSTKYNTITWSYNKSSYSDEAESWFHLYTFEGAPNKMSYSVFNKPSYTIIQNSLSAKGYKLTNSEIEDNEIISTFANTKFILKITTEKRDKKEEYTYRNESITAYRFLLIKKSGVYDPDNGKKVDYWYEGENIQAEYTLKNGKLNGTFISYYYDGKVRKTGNYLNGAENGKFKEYNEEGFLNFEYSIKNDVYNGAFKMYYENSQLKKSGNFINGKQSGNFKEYDENGWLVADYTMGDDEFNGTLTIYDGNVKYEEKEYVDGNLTGKYKKYFYNDNGELFLIQKGYYQNEKENGIWTLSVIEEDGEGRILNLTTYINGVKNGKFQQVQGDSLVFGSYSDDKLNGKYKIYVDVSRMLLGGVIRTDSSNMNISCLGKYYNGLKTGEWKYFDLTGSLTKKGRYSTDEQTGQWSYYYPKYIDNKSNPMPYSEELYLTETYQNGLKNGLSIRYSSLEDVKYLCDTSKFINVNPIDTCYKKDYKKDYQSLYFKDDQLHGPCLVKDSSNIIIFQGNFRYGEKDGEWLDSYVTTDSDDKEYYIFEKGNYINGKRSEKWMEYVNEDFIWNISTYSNGKLNGKLISFLNNGNPREIKQLENNYLKELNIYDSLGFNVLRKYEILKETTTYLKVRKTDYNMDNTVSLEYWMKKDEPLLNHRHFEIIFLIKTGDFGNGESGYMDGTYKYFNKEGVLLREGVLYKENKIGLWTVNYPVQNIQIQIKYSDNISGIERYLSLDSKNLFNGIFVYNDTEKNLLEERKIKNGLRNGTTQYFDLSGEKVKKVKYKNGIKK